MMKKKWFATLLIMVLIITSCRNVVLVPIPGIDSPENQGGPDIYSGGNGTPETPYQIGSLADFQTMHDYFASGSPEYYYYELPANSTFNLKDWEPIGSLTLDNDGNISGTPFIGSFNGNGSSVTISISDDAGDDSAQYNGLGFFSGISGSSTEVSNLTVSGTINAPGNRNAGLIAGIISDGAQIVDCAAGSTGDGSSVTAEIAGGIAGKIQTSGKITGSRNYASVSTTEYLNRAGGIVGQTKGENNSIEISSSQNFGNITSDCYAGGIIGIANGTTVLNCTNDAQSTIKGGYSLGGIVGLLRNGSVIDNSINNGTIEIVSIDDGNEQNIGGVAGNIESEDSATISIRNSANKGIIKSSLSTEIYNVGGIVGMSNVTTDIENCINEKDIKLTDGKAIGGIVGRTNKDLSISSGNGKTANSGNISGTDMIGGIFGGAESGNVTIEGTENNGSITGTRRVGGIAGLIQTGSISTSNNLGSVNITTAGAYSSAAGILGGYKSGASISISDSDNGAEGNADAGKITSVNYAAGIVGRPQASDNTPAKLEITSCNNYGSIEGSTAGGIASQMTGNSKITSSNNYGNITGTGTSSGDIGGIVGFVGCNSGAKKTEITQSNSSGNIDGSGVNIGGIIGNLDDKAKVSNCESSNSITNKGANLGGIVGRIGLNKETSSDILFEYCKFTGTVPSDKNTIVGINWQSAVSKDSFVDCTSTTTGKTGIPD